MAVSEHPRTSAALAMRDEQKYVENEARSALYPQIGVDLSGRHRIADNFEERFDNITQRSLRDTAANVSIIGRQLLFDGGSTYSRMYPVRTSWTN
ncbi:MAG: TolC family protein [Emcibacteraceae bacterium]|nr:TolC family protein [Emcibacteraceae bacterium]